MAQEPTPSQSQSLNLQDYIDFFFRRKWVIIILCLLIFTSVTLYKAFQPDEYLAVSTFVIENQAMNSFGMGSRMPYPYFYQTRPIEFYQVLLRSEMLVKSVLRKVREDSVLAAFEYLTEDRVAGIVRSKVTLHAAEYSDLIRMTTIAEDPLVVYRLATIVADEFKERCREVEQEEASNTVQFVSRQKEMAREKLEGAERALQEFERRTNFNIMLENPQSGVMQRLMELENKLAEVQTQRELAEATLATYNRRLQDLETLRGRSNEAGGARSLDSPVLNQIKRELNQLEEEKIELTERYGEASFQVKDKQTEIERKRDEYYQVVLQQTKDAEKPVSKMDESLWQQLQEKKIEEELNLYILRNRERQYERMLATYRDKNPQMLEHSIELARLQRQKNVYENLYNFLVERGEEANIKAATGTGGVRFIDYPAIPLRPIQRSLTRTMILALMLGLAVGFGVAFVLELLDNTIKSPDEVEKLLKKPLIGSIPIFKQPGPPLNLKQKLTGSNHRPVDQKKLYRSQLISNLQPRDPVVDNYRTLRTNLQFSSVDRKLKSILITSSVPGEGKTVNTANLGISLAELGNRVVLVDGDLRKPRLNTTFSVPKSPGLTDYLAKESMQLEEVLYSSHMSNLKIIPSGTIPPNPAEMIASRKMQETLTELKRHFDTLIIDSPPLGIVTDPVLFAMHCDQSLLIMRFGETNWKIAADACEKLERARANFLGIILNGVKYSRGYGTYYHYNYYYQYHYSDKPGKVRRKSKPYNKRQVKST